MKGALTLLIILSFGLIFITPRIAGAQEAENNELCAPNEQEIIEDEEVQEQPCEQQPEFVPVKTEPIDRLEEKGVPSRETVAGTEAELANTPAVLGESTEVLADTGAAAELSVIFGGIITITALLLTKTTKKYKL